MDTPLLYLALADLILIAHSLLVLFIVLGLVAIIIGKLVQWAWVYNLWFRVAHLAAISVVMLQSWLGVLCPLTTWEMALRSKANTVTYEGSFISYWLKKMIYFDAPSWVFILSYTLFAIAVITAWFWVRPYRKNPNDVN